MRGGGRTVSIEPPRSLEEIRDLAHEIWREHYPGIITSDQVEYMLVQRYSREALERSLASGVRYACARIGSTSVGYSADAAGDAPDTWWLDSLYVRAAFRRRGVARALLEEVVARAAGSGARRLALRVNEGNASAIASYRRVGFVPRGEMRTDIGGGFVMDDIRMELDLDPRASAGAAERGERE